LLIVEEKDSLQEAKLRDFLNCSSMGMIYASSLTLPRA